MTLLSRLQDASVGTDYRLLLACYQSGQVSEAQWQAHMRDEVFAAWVKKATSPAASVGPAAPGNRP